MSEDDKNLKYLINKYEDSLRSGKDLYLDAEEIENISDYYSSIGDRKSSASVLDMGLRLHGENESLIVYRAFLYYDNGDYDRAEFILDRIPDNKEIELYVLKTCILVKRGETEEAEKRAGLIINEASAEDIADCVLSITQAFISSNLFKIAKELFYRALKRFPENMQLYENLALCNISEGNYYSELDTVNIYNNILDVNPYRGDIWSKLGDVYFNIEMYEDAVEAYDMSLAILGEDKDLLFRKGNSLSRADRNEEAAVVFKKSLEYSPDDTEILLSIAVSYERAFMAESAMDYFSRVYNIDNGNHEACVGFGVCMSFMGDDRNSLKWFSEAKKGSRSDAEPWVYSAEIFSSFDMQDKALYCYYSALEIDAKQVDVCISIGIILFNMDEYEKALSYFRKAEEIDDNADGLSLFLALSLAKTDKLSESKAYLDKAGFEDPNAVNVYNDIINNNSKQKLE